MTYANVIIALAAIATFWITHQSLLSQVANTSDTLNQLAKQTSALEQQASTSAAEVAIIQEQGALASLEDRPYVHTESNSLITTSTTIPLGLINGGNIPASVIYQGEIAGIFPNGSNVAIGTTAQYHIGIGDYTTLYPGGSSAGLSFGSSFIPSSTFEVLESGSDILEIASCIIYEPLDQNDNRRWEDDELWSFSNIGSSLIFAQDQHTTNTQCLAAPLFGDYKH